MIGLKLKISALVIVVGISSVVPAGLVSAQLGIGNAVPTSDAAAQRKIDSVNKALNGTSSSLTGTVGTIVKVVGEVRKQLDKKCLEVVEKAATAGQVAFLASFTSTNLGLIGGGGAEAALNIGQTKALEFAHSCATDYVKKLTAFETTNLQAAADIAREQQTFSSIRDALGQRVDAMSARASASWKDVLKALMVRVILNLNKNLTTSVVNKMVDKYKISNYQAYGDALASQVYSMKYISEKYDGDVQTQMMLRSILQSDKLPEKIKTAEAAASAKAQTYLGKTCNVTGSSTANIGMDQYVKCLTAYGSAQADPQFHMFQGQDQARAAKSAGQANANAEISQSNGFAPPRNCSGSLDAQKQIDAQFDKVAMERNIAIAARDKLYLALKAGKTTSAEYAKAADAASQAIANYEQVNKQKNNPIIDICEGITSPAAFVSTTINDFLKQHLDQTSQLKSDNLPFYATFLADMASNFLTNILTGGKSTSQVFKEGGAAALNSALGGLQTVINPPPGTGGGGTGGGTPTPPGTPDIYATPDGSSTNATTSLTPGQTYQIIIDYDKVEVQEFKPYKIVVTGLGPGADINRNITGEEIVAREVVLNYRAGTQPVTISVSFFAKNFDNKPDVQQGPFKVSFTVGNVRGASIILPRGPELSFR